MPPQTDGRTLWEPRGEIYLQIIQQKWREGETVETEGGEGGERARAVAERAREGGTKREAGTEPGCAERQASLRQAHRKQTVSPP